MERPRFKPQYTVEIIEGQGVLFLTEKESFSLKGSIYELVASQINGTLPSSGIVNSLIGKADVKEVENALLQLETRGLLIEADDSISDSEATFWWMQGIDPKIAASRLKNSEVSVRTFGKIAVEPFLEVLKTFGIRPVETGNVGIVITDDYLNRDLAEYNQESLNTDRSWILIKPVGTQLWTGPIFIPARPGCWECLAYRLRMHRKGETLLWLRKNAFQPVWKASTRATLNAALNLAGARIAKWIANGELYELEGRIITEDFLSGESQNHLLVWRPQCPACGDPVEQIPETAPPVVLQSTTKIFTVDGGHRVTIPEATLEKYQHHISPITGIVRKLDPYGVSKAGALHVYGGSLNCALPHDGLNSLVDVMTSSGKGASDIQAKTSALCESLERFSGIFRGDEPRRKARFKDLGDTAIHPDECNQFSEQQYKNRDLWNKTNSLKLSVPMPFDEEREIEWSPVWSLTHNLSRFIPTAFCYYHYPSDPNEAFTFAHSNGNAAGNTLEEAILQGFLELIERDSIAIWWFNGVQRPSVDWRTFDLPYLEEVRRFHSGYKRELWVLDITSDLQVPAFVALSKRTEGPEERIIVGFGSHLDAKIAILRAITEVNQSMVWASEISHSPEAANQQYYISLQKEVSLKTITTKDLPHVVPDPNVAARVATDYMQRWSKDLKEDVLICKAIIEEQGMEMLVLDQTRGDVGLPVVKVIVPGLRHFWPRLAPGRLYDVPVKLGWQERPLKEEELNPIFLFS
jgi:oxazoline/thiazoline synthase